MSPNRHDPSGPFLARMEKVEGKVSFTLLDRITYEELEAAKVSVSVLVKLYRGFNIHLRIAFEDLAEELANATDMVLQVSELDDTAEMRLTHRVISFSVALRMYNEHVVGVVSSKWGKSSVELRECKQAFSEVFDRSLGYRVTYALRNALVHSKEQLIGLNYSSYLLDPGSPGSEGGSKVHLTLRREVFAEADVRAQTRAEVAGLERDPDLAELFEEVLVETEKLNDLISPLLFPEVKEATSALFRLAGETFPTSEEPPVFLEVDGDFRMIGYMPVREVFWDFVLQRERVGHSNSTSRN